MSTLQNKEIVLEVCRRVLEGRFGTKAVTRLEDLILSLKHGREAGSFEKVAEYKYEPYEFSIRINRGGAPRVCPICGDSFEPALGPVVHYLQDEPVCETCGLRFAGPLQPLIGLQEVAIRSAESVQRFLTQKGGLIG